MSNIKILNSKLNIRKVGNQLTERQIIDAIPNPFKGKEHFIEFYLDFNGIVFSDFAFFYCDSFYKVSEDEYNLLIFECFLHISDSENSLNSMWDSLKENKKIKSFANTHIPFAIDSSGNYLWIEQHSGIIKYVNMETPVDITFVAPSFLEFCKHIVPTIRK